MACLLKSRLEAPKSIPKIENRLKFCWRLSATKRFSVFWLWMWQLQGSDVGCSAPRMPRSQQSLRAPPLSPSAMPEHQAEAEVLRIRKSSSTPSLTFGPLSLMVLGRERPPVESPRVFLAFSCVFMDFEGFSRSLIGSLNPFPHPFSPDPPFLDPPNASKLSTPISQEAFEPRERGEGRGALPQEL